MTVKGIRAVLCAGICLLAVWNGGCTASKPATAAGKAPPTVATPACRGTLGMEAVALSRDLRKTLAFPRDARGAVVSEVLPGGPAAAAGVRVHDLVVRIGGVPIANDCDFDAAAYSRSCGPVDVVVHRGDEEVKLTLDAIEQGPFLQRSCRNNVPSACFRQAWVVWVRGKPEENGALGLFESACRAGSAEACAYEGLELVGLGRGAEATAALERACELGSGGGCATFGFLFATGKFEAKDDRRAASLYAKACDLGDAQGCYNAGLMSDEGRGVAWDGARAAALYGEACELGSSTGCTNLGFLYEHGRGVGKDGARAIALYQRGCEGTRCVPSNLGGCLNLGRAYRDGLAVEKDERRAAEIFREACERKPVPDDIHADENGARGCSLLGALDLAGDGVEQDLEQARTLSELGCDRGDSFGCFNAAAIYAAGSGVAKDPVRAAAFLDRACQGGDGEGCDDLAIAYQKGNGVARDPRRAAELFAQACRLGFEAACSKKKR